MDEYVARCRELYAASEWGWPEWCQRMAEEGFFDGRTVEDTVAKLNYSHECRKADRNV